MSPRSGSVMGVPASARKPASSSRAKAVFAGGGELVYERCFVLFHAVFEQDQQAG